MKNIVQQSILSLLCGAALTTQAGTPVQSTASTPSIAEAAGCCHHYADSPIGVMFDHTHAAGGFMVGHRYFRSEFSGLQKNGSGISTDVVFDDGFTAAPTAMSMDMHMLEIMYSPTGRRNFYSVKAAIRDGVVQWISC
jgi:hypothetical protein